MITYKQWDEKAKPGETIGHEGSKQYTSTMFCDGWYLFGIIPLYTRRMFA